MKTIYCDACKRIKQLYFFKSIDGYVAYCKKDAEKLGYNIYESIAYKR